ncbi:TolA protein [Minicystis rosea]|nr:TolA protein [Minicystis rosea]
MTPEASLRPGLHPSIVLSAYVEPLVRGRRVAILGDATIGLSDELSQRGARLVHVYDPDTARTAEALARAAPGRPHQVAYAVLAGDLGVRDGAFDVVIVPDLTIFTDPADVMRRARRLCATSGVAVFVTPNAGAGGRRLLAAGRGAPVPPPAGGAALGYYELYDLVSLQFAKVRMIGQAPFVGYTVADFTRHGEPEVSVDTSLLASSEEPEHFIALASDRPISLDAYAVIELPWHDVADAIVPSEKTLSVRTAERLALAEAETRVTLLSGELEKLRERAAEQSRDAETRVPVAAALSARVAELEAEIQQRDAKLKETEARAGDNHVRAERLTNQIRDLDEELRRQRDRGTKLSKLLDDEKKGRTKAEVELGMIRGAPGSKERIDALTADLAASQSRISDLEMELAETRRRPVIPGPPAQDSAMLSRLVELEQSLSAALRDAEAAFAQRDSALERARLAEVRAERVTDLEVQLAAADARLVRTSSLEAQLATAEARAQRAASLEAQVAAEQRDKVELDARARGAVGEVADLERRLLSERDRADAAGRIASDGTRRLAEAEKQAGAVGERAARLAHELAEAEKRAADLETRLSEQDRRLAELSDQIADERRKAGQAADDRSALEAAAAEIEKLEAALRERGRVITSLTRDLREAERVGRELLSDMESARGFHGNGVVVTGPEDLRGRLDALAQSAARSEADLQAATWRIAQLERELEGARREAGEPARAQLELEQALAAARDEVAALRKALGGGAS